MVTGFVCNKKEGWNKDSKWDRLMISCRSRYGRD